MFKKRIIPDTKKDDTIVVIETIVTDYTFHIREEHMAQDIANVIQLGILSGYIECCEDYEIEIDPDIVEAYNRILAELPLAGDLGTK